MTKRKPKDIEDALLNRYWERVKGQIHTEVPIGGRTLSNIWPSGSKIRRTDGIRLTIHKNARIASYHDSKQEFHRLIQKHPVEFIEIKRKLNRPVIGQIVAGVKMFERQEDFWGGVMEIRWVGEIWGKGKGVNEKSD